MKKITLSLIAASLVVLPLSALANANGTKIPDEPTGFTGSLSGVVAKIMSGVWIAFAGLAVILFVYAGVRFLTAGGSPEKVQEARTAAVWGVVGVVVMILAYAVFSIATGILA